MPETALQMDVSNTLESAWSLRESNSQQSLQLVSGLREACAPDTADFARILIVESNVWWRNFELPKMMATLVEAFEILSGSQDSLWVSRMHGRINAGLATMGEVTSAYKHLHLQLQAAQCSESGTAKNWEIFGAHHNMGRHFYLKSDFIRADQCYRRCYRYAAEADASFVLLLQNHADTHAKLGQFRVAKMEIKRALELGPQVGAERAMVYAMGVKANIYSAQGKLERAKAWHAKARDFAIKHSLPSVKQRMRLAALFLSQNQIEQAETELKPAEVLNITEGDRHEQARYQQLKSELHAAKNEHESALHHFKKYHKIKEEIFSLEKDHKAESEGQIHRLSQLRRESARLKQRNAALQHSIVQLKSQHEETRKLSERDSLTTLYNRRMLMELANSIIEIGNRTQSDVAVAVVDLDHFKRTNDRHGHATGDRVLEKFALLLMGTFRSADCVARYGGEEFVVVMPNTGIKVIEKALERLRNSVDDYRWSEVATGLNVTFSAGIAARRNATSFDELFRDADNALYTAKFKGRNRTVAHALDSNKTEPKRQAAKEVSEIEQN